MEEDIKKISENDSIIPDDPLINFSDIKNTLNLENKNELVTNTIFEEGLSIDLSDKIANLKK